MRLRPNLINDGGRVTFELEADLDSLPPLARDAVVWLEVTLDDRTTKRSDKRVLPIRRWPELPNS